MASQKSLLWKANPYGIVVTVTGLYLANDVIISIVKKYNESVATARDMLIIVLMISIIAPIAMIVVSSILYI